VRARAVRSGGAAPRGGGLLPRSLRLLLVLLVPGTSAPAEEERGLRPGETVGGLRGSPPVESRGELAAPPGPGSLLVRLGGGLGLVGLGGGGLLLLSRRLSRTRRARGPSEEIRILARASLAPRHGLALIEVRGQRILVGLSRDHLTSIAVLSEPPLADGSASPRSVERKECSAAPEGDPPAVCPQGAPGPQRPGLQSRGAELRGRLARSSYGIFDTRWRDDEPGGEGSVTRDDVEPYRRQVERLRGLLDRRRAEGPGERGAAGA
jgi:flagellar biogenesis protein FliO